MPRGPAGGARGRGKPSGSLPEGAFGLARAALHWRWVLGRCHVAGVVSSGRGAGLGAELFARRAVRCRVPVQTCAGDEATAVGGSRVASSPGEFPSSAEGDEASGDCDTLRGAQKGGSSEDRGSQRGRDPGGGWGEAHAGRPLGGVWPTRLPARPPARALGPPRSPDGARFVCAAAAPGAPAAPPRAVGGLAERGLRRGRRGWGRAELPLRRGSAPLRGGLDVRLWMP